MSGIPEEVKLESAPDAKPLSLIDLEKQREIWRRARKKYVQKHKDKVRESRKKWFSENKDKVKEMNKRYKQKRRENKKINYQKERTYQARWVKNNPEKMQASRNNWKKNNPWSSAVYRQARRAKIRGVFAENFSPIEIFNRDAWVCQLCHKKVNKDLRWPDPMSASLDHIVPISKGGSHTKNNTHLAHLKCNIHAGVGGVKQTLLPLEIK